MDFGKSTALSHLTAEIFMAETKHCEAPTNFTVNSVP